MLFRSVVCSVVIQNQVHHLVLAVRTEETESFQKLHCAVLVGSIGLHKESSRKAGSDSSVHRHIPASLLVENKWNGCIGVLPSLPRP